MSPVICAPELGVTVAPEWHQRDLEHDILMLLTCGQSGQHRLYCKQAAPSRLPWPRGCMTCTGQSPQAEQGGDRSLCAFISGQSLPL